MHQFPIFILIISLFSFSLLSCSGKETKEKKKIDDSIKKEFQKEAIKVGLTKAEKKAFEKELLSNGKLNASKKADIPFKLNEVITSIRVKNGDRVAKGAVLATLDKEITLNKLEQSRIALKKAKIEFQDILLGFGFQLKDTATVPKEILNNIKIKSNYENAQSNLKDVQRQLTETTVRAPFAGTIANLEAKPHNLPATFNRVLCTIINASQMEVVFPILESELNATRLGKKVEVITFADSTTPFLGKITEINPIVDKNGLVEVKATIANKNNKLFDGMNVKVKIKNRITSSIVVPKTAVLLRQDKKVVFKFRKGEAIWKYVETGAENSTEIIIKSGIKEGDRIIVSGNENLAHKSKVQVLKD